MFWGRGLPNCRQIGLLEAGKRIITNVVLLLHSRSPILIITHPIRDTRYMYLYSHLQQRIFHIQAANSCEDASRNDNEDEAGECCKVCQIRVKEQDPKKSRQRFRHMHVPRL